LATAHRPDEPPEARPDAPARARPPDEPPKARLFVALDLPEQARAALVEWQKSALVDRGDLRAVASEALHVTLAFLGHRPATEIELVIATVAKAIDGLAPARLTPLAAKPVPRRRPRLFALDLDDDGERAGAVQATTANALAAGGFYTPERRAFWPHVTVARVNRTERRTPPLAAPPPAEPFDADALTLYRSHLGRGPARYERLATWRLTAPWETAPDA
jgi:RNA 2',3'-cyclic 3'-phosphodiesterase